jgi:hypothetical protein
MRIKGSKSFGTATVAFLSVVGILQGQQVFPDHCPDGRGLPFASIEVKHPVDTTCPWLNGKQSSPSASKLQNSVKNNFCITVPLAKAKLYTPQQLIELQGKTSIATGEGQEPASRSAAQALGEGQLIKLVAFVIEAHYADIGTGESVNCGGKTEPGNDIHIALGTTATTPECASVTAEISPHYRPATWEQVGHFQTYNTTTGKTSVDAALKAHLQAQPFRFTGQLFFDASHSPCACGTNCSPARSSDWEIHPIYRIEACKSGTQCDADDDNDWIAFDAWWKPAAVKATKEK